MEDTARPYTLIPFFTAFFEIEIREKNLFIYFLSFSSGYFVGVGCGGGSVE